MAIKKISVCDCCFKESTTMFDAYKIPIKNSQGVIFEDYDLCRECKEKIGIAVFEVIKNRGAVK